MELRYQLCRGLLTKGPFWDFLEENIGKTFKEVLPRRFPAVPCSVPTGCLYVCVEERCEDHVALRLPDPQCSTAYMNEAREIASKIAAAKNTGEYRAACGSVRHGMVVRFSAGGVSYLFIFCTDEGSEALLRAGLLHLFTHFRADPKQLNALGDGNLFWEALCRPTNTH